MTLTPASAPPLTAPAAPTATAPQVHLAASSAPPSEPLAYHRLALTHPRHRWWRPLVQLLVFVLVTIGLTVLAFATAELLRLVPTLREPISAAIDGTDLTRPWTLALMLALVALMLPAAMLTQRICAPVHARRLSSVTGRLRWDLLWRCLGLAALAFAPLGLTVALTGRGGLHIDDRALAMLVVVLAVVPVQAAAEEYAFRGLLMQLLGAWVRHPAFAILAPVPLFVFGHGYGPLGSVDVAAFAIVAGWLTWRTGGLEAAIGLHIVNNVAIMSLGAFGMVDLNATDTSLAPLLFSIATLAAYSWLVLRHGMRPSTERLAQRRTRALR